MAVFAWPPHTERYNKVARFVTAFFSKFDQFQRPPRHPKWREVNLTAQVPGWTRFQAAEDWLVQQTTAGTAGGATQERFNAFLAQTNPGVSSKPDGLGEGGAVPAVPCVGQAAYGGTLTVSGEIARRHRQHLSLLALCALPLLTAGKSFAAPDRPGDAQASPAVQADQACEALLLKIEKQISDGHTAAPPDDNALLTWRSVITRSEPATPETLRALQDFVARATNRQAAEHAAGRRTVEVDLKLFEGLASELISRATASLGNQAAKSDTQAATPPPGATPTDAPAADAAGVADGRDPGHPAVPDTALALAEPSAPAPAIEASLMRRGDAMLAIKDISAARKLYESAADAGSAPAALALAKTFDPAYLDTLGVVGLRPDPASAAAWYRKAAALGDRDAEARLRTLARSTN